MFCCKKLFKNVYKTTFFAGQYSTFYNVGRNLVYQAVGKSRYAIGDSVDYIQCRFFGGGLQKSVLYTVYFPIVF